MLPLKYILSYLDYNALSTVFNLSVTLRKDIKLKKLFYGENLTDAEANNITLNFKSIKLRIPKITPTPEMDRVLKSQITSDKKSYADVLSRKIFTRELEATTNEIHWVLETGKSNLPSYLGICFKITGEESYNTNNSKYLFWVNNTQFIESIQVDINGVYYPDTALNICNDQGFRNNDAYTMTFDNIQKMGNMFPYNNYEFENFAGILIFDLTKRQENATQGTNSISIKIKKRGAWKVFALVLTEETYQLDYKNKMIRSE